MATINRNSRTFSDINLLFEAHPSTGDIVKNIDENAVKAAVRNLVSTANYERPFHPEIGCQVYNLLFENFTPMTAELVRKSIINVLDVYEPRAKVLDVRVSDTDDVNQIAITVEFKVINSDKPVTVTTFLDRVR